MTEQPATLHTDGYGGRASYAVLVVGETPKRYRVRLLETVPAWPGRARCAHQGEVRLVPKHAVRFTPIPEGARS